MIKYRDSSTHFQIKFKVPTSLHLSPWVTINSYRDMSFTGMVFRTHNPSQLKISYFPSTTTLYSCLVCKLCTRLLCRLSFAAYVEYFLRHIPLCANMCGKRERMTSIMSVASWEMRWIVTFQFSVQFLRTMQRTVTCNNRRSPTISPSLLRLKNAIFRWCVTWAVSLLFHT